MRVRRRADRIGARAWENASELYFGIFNKTVSANIQFHIKPGVVGVGLPKVVTPHSNSPNLSLHLHPGQEKMEPQGSEQRMSQADPTE